MELAAPRKVQRDGDRVFVSLPEEAVEGSGLTVGDETMVAYREDGPIVLVPWAREDVVDMFREDGNGRRADGNGERADGNGERTDENGGNEDAADGT